MLWYKCACCEIDFDAEYELQTYKLGQNSE